MYVRTYVPTYVCMYVSVRSYYYHIIIIVIIMSHKNGRAEAKAPVRTDCTYKIQEFHFFYQMCYLHVW